MTFRLGGYRGVVLDNWQETHDVRSLRIKTDKPLNFVPGQYCLVSLDGFKGEKRPFTFTNIPGASFVELTIKRAGRFTSALHSLAKGDTLRLYGPQGTALNFNEKEERDVVFLAGGSGITPFIAALRYAAGKALLNRFWLFYSNKTPADIIYRDELERLGQLETVNVINTITDYPAWPGPKGRITKETVLSHVKPEGKVWYICGPPPMVAGMRQLLEGLAISRKDIKWEDWQIP